MVGDSASSPPASIVIENDAAPVPENVFSASLSTENVAFTDPSLMPVKGKMMKKQFFLGLLFPVIVGIIFAISIESLNERDRDDWEGELYAPNEQGEFSIDLTELGWNCDDDSYYEVDLNWKNSGGDYSRFDDWASANYNCEGELRYHANENIGTIHENGSMELDFLSPPTDGYNVEFKYYKDGVSRTESLGQGDGVNTIFSGNVDPDYCDGHGTYEFLQSQNRFGERGFYLNGGDRPCTIFEEGEYIIDSKLKDGVLTFKLPDSYSHVKEINVHIYSYDENMEFFFAFLPCLGCLLFIGVGVGAYMSGYKWFAYGVGASAILVPAFLFVLFMAALAAYGF
ncbi:hypothetical protein OAJ94_02180 [Deltaproteobacteria bacterium]|nr:hypothetical protein [Deltaproteobacteria bacterium]